MKPGIYITLSRDGRTGGFRLAIEKRDGDGDGYGYRLAGPKFGGRSEELQAVRLGARDRDEIRKYLDQIADDAT